MRSSTAKSADLEGLMPTPTTTSSKMRRLRSMRSRCPLCTGSNMPGYTARLPTRPPHVLSASARRIVAARSKESQGRLPESARAKRGEAAVLRGRRSFRAVLRDDDAVGHHERERAESLERRGHRIVLVRRIEEDDVEARSLTRE